MNTTKFSATRLCIECREWHPYPETDEGWTTRQIEDTYFWVCPDCSASGDDAEDDS